MKKNKNGITLIALVITIIVLLILAGISIIMLSGENSILKRAVQAKETSDIEKEKEQIILAYNSAIIENVELGNIDTGLQIELDKLVGNDKTFVSPNDDDTLNILFYDSQHNYTVDGNNVTLVKSSELHITNYTELLNFANEVNSGNSFKNDIVYLDNDVIIEDDECVMIGCFGGRDDPSMFFEGVFDGNNHFIKEVNISSGEYQGLFYENAGTIRNLKVEANLELSNGRCTGGGICSINSGSISNCEVNITSNVNSHIDGRSSYLGGICGHNFGIVENCITFGEINTSGKLFITGGIAGENLSDGSIKNCKNEASIIFAHGSEGGGTVGGIVGENNGLILRCINTGELELKSENGGGIAGKCHYRNNK